MCRRERENFLFFQSRDRVLGGARRSGGGLINRFLLVTEDNIERFFFLAISSSFISFFFHKLLRDETNSFEVAPRNQDPSTKCTFVPLEYIRLPRSRGAISPTIYINIIIIRARGRIL